MERSDREENDGGFIATLAFTGSVMVGMEIYSSGDVSMRVMGGIFLAPAIIKYSAMAGRVFYNRCCISPRTRKFEKIGRNFGGKYLGGKL